MEHKRASREELEKQKKRLANNRAFGLFDRLHRRFRVASPFLLCTFSSNCRAPTYSLLRCVLRCRSVERDMIERRVRRALANDRIESRLNGQIRVRVVPIDRLFVKQLKVKVCNKAALRPRMSRLFAECTSAVCDCFAVCKCARIYAFCFLAIKQQQQKQIDFELWRASEKIIDC